MTTENQSTAFQQSRALLYGLDGRKIDERAGFRLLSEASESGDLEARAMLARRYYCGCAGTKSDKAKAVELARQASEIPFAAAVLGCCCQFGEGGVPKDETKAKEWYRKAFEGYKARVTDRDLVVQYNLGLCYEFGEGVEKNAVAAAGWYRQAADKGLPAAQLALGACYARGVGVAQNFETAVQWYRRAADRGLSVAQYNLGVCYLEGSGVSKSPEVAVKWFRQAAEQDLPSAQHTLSCCYLNGVGVPKDLAEACKWLQRAVELDESYIQDAPKGEGGVGVTLDGNWAFEWF